MTRRKTFQGASLDEALSSACADLDVRLEELNYDVVETGSGEPAAMSEGMQPSAAFST